MNAWITKPVRDRLQAGLGGRSGVEFLRSALQYFTYSVLGSVLGFLTIPYLARHLSPEDFGQIGLFLSVTYVLGPAISFAAISLVGVNKAQLDEPEFARFKGAFLAYGCGLFVGFELVGLIVAALLPEFAVIAVTAPLLCFIRLLSQAHGVELVQMRQPARYGVLNTATSCLALGTTVLMISLLELSWTGRILALLVAEAAVMAVRYRWYPTSVFTLDFHAARERTGSFLRFGAPLMVGLGAAWVMNESSKYVILHFYSLKEVGIYTVPAMLGLVIHSINEAVSNSYYPRIADQLRAGKGYRTARKFFWFYGLVALGLAGGMTLLGYTASDLLFGPNFPDCAPIIAFVSLAYGLAGMNRTMVHLLTYYKKTGTLVTINYAGAIVNVLVSVALVPVYGLVAPAMGTALAYFLIVLLTYRAAFRELKRQGIQA